jgi:SAM-dependent methyltransferase
VLRGRRTLESCCSESSIGLCEQMLQDTHSLRVGGQAHPAPPALSRSMIRAAAAASSSCARSFSTWSREGALSTAKKGFGAEVASAYESGRPTYPVSMLRESFSDPDQGVLNAIRASIAENRPFVVVDVGAGTGKFLRPCLQALAVLILEAQGVAASTDPVKDAISKGWLKPYAVEPSDMGKVLPRTVPGIRAEDVWDKASADSVPLPTGSVDLVTCGQALHWFATPSAAREFARLLRPRIGSWCFAWNTRHPGLFVSNGDDELLPGLSSPSWLDDSSQWLWDAERGRCRIASAQPVVDRVLATLGEDCEMMSVDDRLTTMFQGPQEGSDLPFGKLVTASLETLIEQHYIASTPRQQSGYWRQLIPDGFKTIPPAGVEAVDPSLDIDAGCFRWVHPDVFRAGAAAVAWAGFGSGAGDCGYRAYFDNLHGKPCWEHPSPVFDDAVESGSLFFPPHHRRKYAALCIDAQTMVSWMTSISAVASADPTLRARSVEALSRVLALPSVPRSPSDPDKVAIAIVRDVLIARAR